MIVTMNFGCVVMSGDIAGSHNVKFFAIPPLHQGAITQKLQVGGKSWRGLVYFVFQRPQSLHTTPIIFQNFKLVRI